MKLACFEGEGEEIFYHYMERLAAAGEEIIKGSTKDIELRRELLMGDNKKKDDYMTALFEVIPSLKIVVADYTHEDSPRDAEDQIISLMDAAYE